MTDTNRYAVIDTAGAIINVVVWDGQGDWPGEGTAVLDGEAEAQIGGQFDATGFSPPPPPPEQPPVPPTFEQLVAQASTFADLKRLVAEKLA